MTKYRGTKCVTVMRISNVNWCNVNAKKHSDSEIRCFFFLSFLFFARFTFGELAINHPDQLQRCIQLQLTHVFLTCITPCSFSQCCSFHCNTPDPFDQLIYFSVLMSLNRVLLPRGTSWLFTVSTCFLLSLHLKGQFTFKIKMCSPFPQSVSKPVCLSFVKLLETCNH